MTRSTWGILALLTTAVAVPSCGGDSSEFSGNPAGRGGSGAGTGGKPSGVGGSAQTGGSGASGGSTSAGTGGTTSTENGGSSGDAPRAGSGGADSAGRPGVGGALGEAGAGASGPGEAGAGPVDCPSTAPENEASCSTAGTCFYVGTRCECAGMEDALRWHCRGSGAACPATAPTAGSSCENEMDMMPLNCPYPDGSECRCEQDKWKCMAPPEPPGEGGGPGEPPEPPGNGGAPDMPEGGRPNGPMAGGRGGREG